MKKIIDYLFLQVLSDFHQEGRIPTFWGNMRIGRSCDNGLFVCCADIVVSLNGRFLFTLYIRENKNYNRDNRLFSALACHISTLQQKKNKRFSGKISGQ